MNSSTTLPASSISPGCILWLTDPDKGRYSYPDSDEDEDPRFRVIPQTMYGHPVMVLHNEGEDNVAVCLLTTLNNRNLEVNKHSFDNEFYLAIYPKQPPCVGLYPQLCLNGGITLRKPGYLCIRQRYSVRRSELELFEKERPADYYKLSPLSYAIVANTFRMNIPIPEKLTWSETLQGMHIPIAGAQSYIRKKIVASIAEPETTHERTSSPAVQAPQDRRIMDQASVTPNTTTHDCRTTEGSPMTLDRSSPVKAEKADDLAGTRNEASRLFSLFMRAMRHSCASGDSKGKGLFYLRLSGSIANYPSWWSWWPGDIGVFESESEAREAWEAMRKEQM